MPQAIFNMSTLPVLEQVVNFTEARHGVLAGNIANIDTPGYKTRDLSTESFQQSLKDAIARRTEPSPSEYAAMAAGESLPPEPIDTFRGVSDADKHILFHDESDVSLESQITELSKNQSIHNMAVSLMSTQFRQLKTAISERIT